MGAGDRKQLWEKEGQVLSLARERWEAHVPFSQQSVPTSASSPLLPWGTKVAA